MARNKKYNPTKDNLRETDNSSNQMVICNQCSNGFPVSNQFVGGCPAGWTVDKDP